MIIFMRTTKSASWAPQMRTPRRKWLAPHFCDDIWAKDHDSPRTRIKLQWLTPEGGMKKSWYCKRSMPMCYAHRIAQSSQLIFNIQNKKYYLHIWRSTCSWYNSSWTLKCSIFAVTQAVVCFAVPRLFSSRPRPLRKTRMVGAAAAAV